MKKGMIVLMMMVWASLVSSQITIQVSPNPNPNLASWQDNPGTIAVRVLNNGEAFEGKLVARLLLDGQLKARTVPESTPSFFFETGMNVFAEADAVHYNAIEFSGVDKQKIARTGQLPAGNYQICFSIMDMSNKPVSQFPEQCAYFTLTQFQPPVLINPSPGIEIASGVRPTFNWTPLVPKPNGVSIQYHLRVFEILPGQAPVQAIRSNQPIVDEMVERTTQFWPTEWDGPQDDQKYVWIVGAQDEDGNPLGENGGFSEPQTFSVSVGGGNGGQKIANGDGWTMCSSAICHIKGVKLELYVPDDAVTTGSTTYKISAWSTPIKYYATASEVIAEFGSTGAAGVDDWIGYVPSGHPNTYCDRDGFPIVNQVVYEVFQPNPTNYNGNTNELHASGACLDFNTFTSLANHYNAYNNSFLDVPTTCPEGCLDGGSNPNDPDWGGHVNAAGDEIDDITLDPIDGDGGVSPGGGGLVGHNEIEYDFATGPNGLVFVPGVNGKYKAFSGDDLNGKNDFCYCWDGSYAVGTKKCDLCPKSETKNVRNTKVKACLIDVNGKSYRVVSAKKCKDETPSFRAYIKLGSIKGETEDKPHKD